MAVLAIPTVACNSANSLVVVNVDAPTPIAGIASLHARVTAGGRTAEFDVHPVGGGAVDIPPAQNFGVDMPRTLSGSVDVHVEARDASQQPLAVGDGAGTIHVGGRVDIQISLGEGRDDMGTDDGGIVPELQISPSPFTFAGNTPRNFAGPTQTFTVTNSKTTLSAVLPAAALVGVNASSFSVTNDGCVGKQIGPTPDSCTIDVRFTPTVSGANSAMLNVGSASAAIAGVGAPIWVQEGTNIDLSTVTLNGVWGADASNVYAVGSQSTILFRNAAGTWSTQSVAGTTNFAAVAGSASTDIWTSNGNHSAGDGSWSGPPFTTQTLTGVWAFAANDAWFSFWSYDGSPDGKSALYHYTLNGFNQAQNPDATNVIALQHLWGTSDSDLYTFGSEVTSCAPSVCSTASIISHPDQTGQWVQQYNTAGGAISSMWGFGSPANNLYATVTTGVPLHSTGNGGWNLLPAPAPNGCAAVWGADPTHLWFACGTNLYPFDGTTWGASQLSGPTILGLWGSSASNAYAVGTTGAGVGGAVYHYY